MNAAERNGSERETEVVVRIASLRPLISAISTVLIHEMHELGIAPMFPGRGGGLSGASKRRRLPQKSRGKVDF